MNEQLVIMEFTHLKIKKKNLLLLSDYLPEIDWLQQIARGVTSFEQDQCTIQINRTFEYIRIAAELQIFKLFLTSEQIDQLVLCCKIIEKTKNLLNEHCLGERLLFFEELFKKALKYLMRKKESPSFNKILTILSPLPSNLTTEQQQTFQKKLNALKQLSKLPKPELLEIILMTKARNFLVPPDQEISIFELLYDPSFSQEDLFLKNHQACLMQFFEIAQTTGTYLSGTDKKQSFDKSILTVFARFVAFQEIPIIDDDLIIIDDDESTLDALHRFECLWEILFCNHPTLYDWLVTCKNWREDRESQKRKFSFYYRDGILVLFSRKTSLYIINLLPSDVKSKKIGDFFKKAIDINNNYDIFSVFYQLNADFLDKPLLRRFNNLFFGEEKDFNSNTEKLMNEVNRAAQWKQIVQETGGEIVPQNYIVSKKEQFRIRYFLCIMAFLNSSEHYAFLLEKIEGEVTETFDIKIAIKFEYDKTYIIFSYDEEEIEEEIIGTLIYKSVLLGMFNMLQTLCGFSLSNQKHIEDLLTYWKITSLIKALDIGYYQKIKKFLNFALLGQEGHSLSKAIDRVLNKWEKKPKALIKRFINQADDKNMIPLLNLENFMSLHPRDQLEKLYQILLSSGLNSDIQPMKRIFNSISPHPKTSIKNILASFFTSKNPPLVLSPSQLEVVCYFLPENLGRPILESCSTAFSSIQIENPNIRINRQKDGNLELSSSQKKTLNYLMTLRDKFFVQKDALSIIRKAMDLKILAKSICPADSNLADLEDIFQQMPDATTQDCFSLIQEIKELSQPLFDFLEQYYLKEWGSIAINHPLGMDGFFSFLAGKTRNVFNSQFKIIHLPYTLEEWLSIIFQFSHSPILQCLPSLKVWEDLYQFFCQFRDVQTQQKACMNFINTLTIWSMESSGISIIELEETTDSIGVMYMKFCEQAHYYARIATNFIDALLDISKLTNSNENEKQEAVQYFDLFLNQKVKEDDPVLLELIEYYQDIIGPRGTLR